jgi:hypothetical protein
LLLIEQRHSRQQKTSPAGNWFVRYNGSAKHAVLTAHLTAKNPPTQTAVAQEYVFSPKKDENKRRNNQKKENAFYFP